jgi:glutamate--cysteine ligase
MKTGFRGYRATMEDWHLHTTTFFPEVRLKNCLEVRNCDCQRSDLMMAFPALLKGVMYNEDALSAVEELVKDISWQELNELRDKVPLKGLDVGFKGHKLPDIALELLSIAEVSLKSQEENKPGESGYLQEIKELVQTGKTPADVVIDNWNSCWGGNIRKFIEYSQLYSHSD